MTTEGRLLKLSNDSASKAFGWKYLVLDQKGPRTSAAMRLMNRIFLWEFTHTVMGTFLLAVICPSQKWNTTMQSNTRSQCFALSLMRITRGDLRI